MFLATGFTILITLLNIAVYYLRKQQEEGYGKRSHQLCRRFSLVEIKSATHNFDEALVVGKGGFGKVYKGTIDKGVCTVAIKRLDLGSKQGAPEFWTEIEMLSRFKHSHLVSLIGYCDDYQEMIIVYEYMPTGSLHDHLHKIGGSHNGTFPLSWVQRLKICIGAARGLDYLHTGTSIQERVIHRDVKSSNILLDENWAAKISDFGLSKIGPANQDCTDVSTHVKGTFGYLDPEYYLTNRITRKSDVYALGVVLLEVLCGRPALDLKLEEEQHSLARWAKKCIKEGKLDQIIDPSLRGQILATCLEEFGQIANQCLHNQPKKRPTMAEVVVKLEYALSLQEITDVSVLGEQIIDGAYDNQDNVEYSPEHAVNNGADGGEHQKEQNDRDAGSGGASGIKSQTVSVHRARFKRKMQSIFSVKTPLILDLEYSDFHLKQVKRFSFHEIQVATEKFSEGNILGGGKFGKVYKGCLVDGSLVAVKRIIEERSQAGELQFQREVEAIGLTLHTNLLPLLGFCTTPTERLLVYPYMATGSVVSRLRERPTWQSVLDWQTRKKIALGSARGLASLHEDYVIHGNIKAASIFLNQFSEVVIGNFRLAQRRYRDIAHRTKLVRGKRVHLAPEFLYNGKFSVEIDVFGYGVMLLELITGQRAFDLPRLANDDNSLMLNWLKMLVDVDLQGHYVHKEVEQLTQVALLCTHDSPMKRPTMSKVVGMLEGTDDGLVAMWEKSTVKRSPLSSSIGLIICRLRSYASCV